MADKLTDAQLSAIIAQQIELAKSYDKNERATARDKAIDYFLGKMDKYVPPEANRSKVVSRDLAETIGWLMPQLMRIWTASGQMFVAEPVEPQDMQYAKSATDGLNHVFWRDNLGYEIVYAATWDSLVHGDGIIKCYFDDTPIYGPAKFHEGLSEDLHAMLVSEDSADVLAQTKNTTQQPDPNDPNTMVDATTYDVKVRQKKANGRITVECIPPEDFLISDDATSLADAAFKAHWQRITRSALVEMGYDKDQVAKIPTASRTETSEQQARRNAAMSTESTDKSMELVDYFECYPMIDVDGDGVAEMLRVCMGGSTNGQLLDWEAWEDPDPFDNIPCEPVPHRWDARSITDEMIEIQDVKTVLARQMLNSTYWSNNPQRFARGKINNPEQLDNPTFGGTVFGDANAAVETLEAPYVGDKALMGIRYMDEVSARRTGVNSQSMALDPEALQNQSATANQNAMDASRSQPELIARNQAEYGWTKVGRKILVLMTKHQAEPRTILVQGKPQEINPGDWNPDMHVTINTGLGTGSRDRDAQALSAVLGQQIAYADRMGVSFPDKALDMLPYIHNTVTKFAESMGLKMPEMYWPEIHPNEIEQGKQQLAQRQQQPDPKQAQALADQQAKEAQAARDHEYRMTQANAKLTLDQQAAAFTHDQKLKQIDTDGGLKRYQIDQELGLKREQLQAELALERQQGLEELAVNHEIGHATVASKANIASSGVHPGGEPG